MGDHRRRRLGERDDRVFTMEPWCCGPERDHLRHAATPVAFLDEAVKFCNDKRVGHAVGDDHRAPATMKDPAVAARARQGDRRAALRHRRASTTGRRSASRFGTAPWGGHPRATLEDIQSGTRLGAQHVHARGHREVRDPRAARRQAEADVVRQPQDRGGDGRWLESRRRELVKCGPWRRSRRSSSCRALQSVRSAMPGN